MKFCCQNFPSRKDGSAIEFYCTRTDDVIIGYFPRYREYMTVHTQELAYDVNYCPWCGIKLPTSLADEWWDVLEKEYGLEDPVHDDREKVPAEFWTDEWWKKRGL